MRSNGRSNVQRSSERPKGRKSVPLDQRIIAAAADLFYRHGIRGVGVEAIAEAAGTNKMTLYRHFGSKDELVAAWLRGIVAQLDSSWHETATKHQSEPEALLSAWFDRLAAYAVELGNRGCPFGNSLAEIPEPNHPARTVIQNYKVAQRDRFVQLCRAARLPEPQLKGEMLFLLLEGAITNARNIGTKGLSLRLLEMGEAIVRPAGKH